MAINKTGITDVGKVTDNDLNWDGVSQGDLADHNKMRKVTVGRGLGKMGQPAGS